MDLFNDDEGKNEQMPTEIHAKRYVQEWIDMWNIAANQNWDDMEKEKEKDEAEDDDEEKEGPLKGLEKERLVLRMRKHLYSKVVNSEC